MERIDYLFSGSSWFQERLDGPQGYLWRKARMLFLFNKEFSSALNLFDGFDYEVLEMLPRPEGAVPIVARRAGGGGSGGSDADQENGQLQEQSWTDSAQDSIRTVLDRIVTRWRPDLMNQKRLNIETLHRSLTSTLLQFVPTTYDGTNNDVFTFDAKRALATYQACLTPLHYHELWSELIQDYKDVDTTRNERETIINVANFYSTKTLDEIINTTIIFGTNRVTFIDSYKHLNNKLGLFDVVLITIGTKDYFGIVVHVEQVKVKPTAGTNEHENRNSTANVNTTTEHNRLKVEIHTTIGVYVSRTCADAFQQQCKATKNKQLCIFKLSNITSSRRMISAIHSLSGWPQHRSLLKPTIEDIYFDVPENFDPLNIRHTAGFNAAQARTIDIAECMFDDIQDRLHIVHGPPGTGKSRTIAGIVLKLLPKLRSKHKILLCAPSNNACDELSRRILDEFISQHESYRFGTLVRVGCQPPDDHRLCEHFLDFMILQELVESFEYERYLQPIEARRTEIRIMKRAKIVVSTLNYCASSRMHSLKSQVDFIIVDEASQSLEADSLLPLRFGCTKLILVGDPLQLPPCVLSDAGKAYGLSQSLYARLYSTFQEHSNAPISMLNTQYRMHPDICRFPSNYFYAGRLLTADSVAIRMRNFSLKPLFLYNMILSRHNFDEASSSLNIGEAGFIQYFCTMLIAHLAQQSNSVVSDSDSETNDEESDSTSSSDSSEDNQQGQLASPISHDHPRSIEVQQRIAVITPYKAQVRLLRAYLPPYIEVMTVDSAQGKEKDIVLISCVRSGGSIGFLDDMKRLNVMLTRSKNALYIVGNFTQLATQHESWNALVTHALANHIIVDVDISRPGLPFRQ